MPNGMMFGGSLVVHETKAIFCQMQIRYVARGIGVDFLLVPYLHTYRPPTAPTTYCSQLGGCLSAGSTWVEEGG